jgi:mono/diheme cytochrome c family protein
LAARRALSVSGLSRLAALLPWLSLAALSVTGLAAAQDSASESPAGAAPSADVPAGVAPAGVADARRAWQNWTLNCQGCHRLDGTGSEGTAPSLAGTVAKFLWVPGGREYLVRVPGVATSPLASDDLAEVVNWMLWRFDKANLPSAFQPFTAAEIAPLRTRPLRLEASQMRTDLLRKAEASGPPP